MPRLSLKSFIHFFSSLKLAVLVILVIALSISIGTILESIYDTPTAQYYIYRAKWFHAVLFFLGVIITVVAWSRYPWRRRHIPFLLAHLGIITLLTGAWITDKFGIDGNLRVSEGEVQTGVELDSNLLYFSEKGKSLVTLQIPWLPPESSFNKINLKKFGLPYDIFWDQYIAHAEPEFHFLPVFLKENEAKFIEAATPALKLKLKGGPMRVSQEFWLWSGQRAWAIQQWGPAVFSIGLKHPEWQGKKGPNLSFILDPKDGSLHFRAISSSGKIETGYFEKNKILEAELRPEWKNITLKVVDWVANARLESTFKPSKIQYGDMAPPPALHLTNSGASVWLYLGEQATFQFQGKEVDIGFFRKRISLPFAIKLERFTIEHDPGSNTPASYASSVEVLPQSSEGKKSWKTIISMNEPLEFGGFTLYQASFENAHPRPTTSILSVNRDSGRWLKYGGSLFIVLGALLLFVLRNRVWKKAGNMKGQKEP